MKLKRKWQPAERLWHLVLTRPSGEVLEPYTGDVYRNEARCNKAAAEFNERRNREKYGSVSCGHRDIAGHWSYVGRIKL